MDKIEKNKKIVLTILIELKDRSIIWVGMVVLVLSLLSYVFMMLIGIVLTFPLMLMLNKKSFFKVSNGIIKCLPAFPEQTF